MWFGWGCPVMQAQKLGFSPCYQVYLFLTTTTPSIIISCTRHWIGIGVWEVGWGGVDRTGLEIGGLIICHSWFPHFPFLLARPTTWESLSSPYLSRILPTPLFPSATPPIPTPCSACPAAVWTMLSSVINYRVQHSFAILFYERIPADTDPQSAFYIGQVVLCHVLSCQPDQAKIRLSFKVHIKFVSPVWFWEAFFWGIWTCLDTFYKSAK